MAGEFAAQDLSIRGKNMGKKWLGVRHDGEKKTSTYRVASQVNWKPRASMSAMIFSLCAAMLVVPPLVTMSTSMASRAVCT